MTVSMSSALEWISGIANLVQCPIYSFYLISKAHSRQEIKKVKKSELISASHMLFGGKKAEWAIDPWPLKAKGLTVLVSPN